MVAVNRGFEWAKGTAETGFQLLKECGLERITQQGVVEMGNLAPETGASDATLGDEAVDMGIPFEIASEGVEDTEKAGSQALFPV